MEQQKILQILPTLNAYTERNIDDYILPQPSAPPLSGHGCWEEAHQVN